MNAPAKGKPQINPRAVMLSKRANVFYLEHAKVIQMDNRIVYLTQDGTDVEKYFNIPERNTAFLLLGKGTSITDAAVRRLAESNVMVGFCGSGGSPLFGALDMTMLAPQSEYMQTWVRHWFDEEKRTQLARHLLITRADLTGRYWKDNIELVKRGIQLPDTYIDTFKKDIENAKNAEALLLIEARWARTLYALLAQGFKIEFSRKEGERKTTPSPISSMDTSITATTSPTAMLPLPCAAWASASHFPFSTEKPAGAPSSSTSPT